MSLTRGRLAGKIAEAQHKVGQLEADRARSLDEAMSLEGDEHFRFQTMQAQAHAEGLLDTGAALIVYAALGEYGSASNGGWAADTSTATKVVVTQLMSELLARNVRAAV